MISLGYNKNKGIDKQAEELLDIPTKDKKQ